MEFNKQSLSIIEGSQILKEEDWQQLADLKSELQDVFLYAQIFRTRTEMEASVLNDLKFPTPDSKYWQSIREQNVMFHELVMLSYEYRKNQVEIKKLMRDLENERDEFEIELLQIEIERKQFISINQERTAKDRIREIQAWHEIKEKLIPQMNASLINCDEHQLISYTARFINQLLNGGMHGSIPERNNLVGQLDKSIKLCEERDCLDKVMLYFPGITIDSIKKAINVN
jgi:hypothetical protein